MKRFTWILAPILLIAVVVSNTMWPSGAVDATSGNQKLYPVMRVETNRELFTDYKGKRVYFRSPSCPPEFKKTPDTYMALMKAAGVILEDAPVKAS